MQTIYSRLGAAAAALAVSFLASRAHAAMASWIDSQHLTLGAASVTLTGFADVPDLAVTPYDLSTSEYVPAGSVSQDALNFLCTDNWTLTSSAPLTNLDLYLIFWRGDDAGVPAAQYTFNQPFTVLSGLAGASHTSTTLTLPAGDVYDGVIRFAGPLTSLTITSNAQLDNAQAMTFAAISVPEPATLALGSMGLFLLTQRRRARRN
jgi:hypothetical protein